METIEVIRLASYVVNICSLIVLSAYFLREFLAKRLRASLAWGIGFLLFAFSVISLAFLTTAEVSKPAVALGFIISGLTVSLLFYGASLLFFREGSFFREKMAAIYFFIVIAVGWTLTYVTPAEEIIEKTSLPSMAMFVIIYIAIAILFYQVSRRIPKDDPRRRTISLVSLSWFIIAFWNSYIGLLVGRYPSIEAGVILLGSFGFVLLLYGMTTGKTTRR